MPTWLITGSSRGIGLEFVRQLVQESSNTVIATCRAPSNASALQSLASSSPSAKLHIIQLDADDDASVEKAAKEVSSLVESIDFLLNNAAVVRGKGENCLNLKIPELLSIMTANVAGPIRVVQAFYSLVRKSERKVIMNMSSGLGSIGGDYGEKEPGYSMSKAALNMFTYKLKTEQPELVVVSMDPGWVKTDMGGQGAFLTPQESISGMLGVLKDLKPKDSGTYRRYDGATISW